MAQELPSDELVFSELYMIGYLCGYNEQPPKISTLPEIMKRCISIGKHGWGLALYALVTALSGGTFPFFAVQPIPFGLVGKMKGIWIIDNERLYKEKLIEQQGFYTTVLHKSITLESGEEYEIRIPEAFGVVIAYEDEADKINYRCFIIQHTGNSNYPWMSIIPSDTTCRKMIEIVERNKHYLSPDEYIEFVKEYGHRIERKEKHEKVHGEEWLEEYEKSEF